jgi:hypothetical protein
LTRGVGNRGLLSRLCAVRGGLDDVSSCAVYSGLGGVSSCAVYTGFRGVSP